MVRLLWLAGLLTLSSLAADPPTPGVHVNNLGVVNNHLWRGAEPAADGLHDLQSAGVTMVIDLRESSPTTLIEKHEAEKIGLKYTNIPFPPLSAPSQDQMAVVLKMLDDNPGQTIFVHCRRGKDRTGTVIACYRIEHDGWDNRRALDEAKTFGMSPAERGMRSFILHFSALPASSPLAAKP